MLKRRDDFSYSPRQMMQNFSVRKFFYAHFNMVNFLSRGGSRICEKNNDLHVVTLFPHDE